MKKILSVLLALAMLPVLVLPATAATTVIDDTVTHSVTEEDATGFGLAFRFVVNAKGVQINSKNEFVNDTATVLHEGKTVALVSMGAIISNDPDTGTNADRMVQENAKPNSHTIAAEGKILCDLSEDSCAFAMRVIHIPDTELKTTIYIRPYYVIAVDGAEQTVYGDVYNRDYHEQWCVVNTILPAVGTDIDVTKQKNRIRVSVATNTGNTVSLTFRNYTSNWITEETDTVTYTCYDADGVVLKVDTIYIGCIDTKKNKEKTFTFEVPKYTYKVALTASQIRYWTEWA